MYDLIKKIFMKSPKINNINKLNIKISINIDTLESDLNLDLDSLKIDDNITEQTEKIANVLSIIGYKNIYLTDLLIKYIEIEKQKSVRNTLIYNNILFFLKEYLLLRDTIAESVSDPIIRPSSAFKLHFAEDK